MNIEKYVLKVILVVAMMLLCTACGKNSSSKLYSDESKYSTQDESDSENTDGTDDISIISDNVTNNEEIIYVQLCGAVSSPGVYSFKNGTRVFEAIEAAGGVTDDADTNAVNLARPVSDEMKIYVPTKEEVNISGSDYFWECEDQSLSEEDSLVDINEATKEELMELPGIGESKADSIINYRDENGAFTDISQIMNISGIKDAAFEKIKDLIKV